MCLLRDLRAILRTHSDCVFIRPDVGKGAGCGKVGECSASISWWGEAPHLPNVSTMPRSEGAVGTVLSVVVGWVDAVLQNVIQCKTRRNVRYGIGAGEFSDAAEAVFADP